MRISDGSSDVCSADLDQGSKAGQVRCQGRQASQARDQGSKAGQVRQASQARSEGDQTRCEDSQACDQGIKAGQVASEGSEASQAGACQIINQDFPTGRIRWETFEHSKASSEQVNKRSEEHTSELQSLMRISYAVFCLKKKKNNHTNKSRKN